MGPHHNQDATSSNDDVEREELHSRTLDMRGFRRSDGLFEIHGRVVDRKTYDFTIRNLGYVIPAHQAIHDMGVSLVFDERMIVQEVHTFTDAAPYAICPQGGEPLQTLKGLKIGSGWVREVRARLGGAKSCTHLMELLFPMATTALQTMSILRENLPDELDKSGRPVKIDTCYAYAAERSLVKQRWPEFYRPESKDRAK